VTHENLKYLRQDSLFCLVDLATPKYEANETGYVSDLLFVASFMPLFIKVG
jgi:hypothetical protein